MKLRDVRKLGIKYCEENRCNYTYIAHNDVEEFYLVNKEDKHTVFIINRNGSLDAYLNTNYAMEFHKELKRRRKNRRRSDKRNIANMYNREFEESVD